MSDKFISIKKKMVFNCGILIIICFSFSLQLLIENYMQNKNLNAIFQKQEIFSAFYAELSNLENVVFKYISASDMQKESVYQECEDAIEKFNQSASDLREKFDTYMAEDYYQMAQTYLSQIEKALYQISIGQNQDQTMELYSSAAKTKDIIENGYISLFESVNDEVNLQKESMKKTWEKIWKGTIICGGIILLLCICHIFRFTKRFLYPVLKLTETAEMIMEEKKEPERIGLDSMKNDEMKILTEAFYRLIDTTNEQVKKLVENQNLEQQLKDEKIVRITVQAQLHQARLKMFQSLVNPHFLFNILSVMADLSMRENAPETQEAIEKLSLSLRYSLTFLNKKVTLSQEADSLRYYFYLQRLRFGDRFLFLIEIDPDCELVELPAMILQPLAENAMQHGIDSYLTGGMVRCSAKREKEEVCIVIEDNGVGMTEEELKVLRDRIQGGLTDDLSDGIGMILAYHRLKEFFRQQAEMTVESMPGKGTKIYINFCEKRYTGMDSEGGRT